MPYRCSPETLRKLFGLSQRRFWSLGPSGPEGPLQGAGWFPILSVKVIVDSKGSLEGYLSFQDGLNSVKSFKTSMEKFDMSIVD